MDLVGVLVEVSVDVGVVALRTAASVAEVVTVRGAGDLGPPETGRGVMI